MARLLADESDGRNRRTKRRAKAATSLRRHDPDQVQRVRPVAVSAPFGTPLEQSKCGPSGSVCQLSLKARLLCGLEARLRPARPEGFAPPYPPEGIAGRPFARLRAAKRAARWARPGTRLVAVAARIRHWRRTVAAAFL